MSISPEMANLWMTNVRAGNSPTVMHMCVNFLSRRARYVLALVLSIGLLISVTPGVSATADRTSSRGPVVALGDSFIAGIGAGSYTEQMGCRRSRASYPARVTQRMGRQLVDLSCPGETIPLAQAKVTRIPRDSAFVFIQIGGNDIGFTHLAGACLIGGRASCLASIAGAHRILASLATPLQELVRSIQRQAPHARVIVMGYPLMVGSPRTCAHIMAADRVSGLTSLQRRLDRTLQRSTTSTSARFLDWPILVDRHSLCSKDPWYALPGDRLDDVLHPDDRATLAVANRVRRFVR